MIPRRSPFRPRCRFLQLSAICGFACAALADPPDFNFASLLGQAVNPSGIARAMDKVREADELRAENRVEDAVAASAEAVAFAPELPAAQALHGHLLRRMGKLDLAIKHLQRAVELQPDYAGAWMEMALTQLQHNNADGALAACDKLIALAPDDAPAHGARGAALLMKKDADRAMDEFTKAISLDKNYAYAYEGRASAYEAQGETKSALVDLDKAHALTREPNLLLRRAAIKTKRNDLDGALEDYGLALKSGIDPQLRAQIHMARAQIYAGWKQDDRVNEERQQALAVLRGQAAPPAEAPAAGNLRLPPAAPAPQGAVTVPPQLLRALQLFQQSLASVQQGRLDAAIAQLDEAIKLAPRFAEAHANRGILLGNRGRIADALADFDKTIELGIKTPAIHAQRGLARALQGDWDGAVKDFDAALKAEPDHLQWRMWRANCLRRLSRFDDAQRDLDRVLQLDPKLVVAYDERARVLALKGQPAAALADASKLIELQPKLAGAWLLRGAIHHQMGNLPSALADLDQAIALDPNLAPAYQERSVVHQRLNRPDLATRDLLKVTELSRPPAR